MSFFKEIIKKCSKKQIFSLLNFLGFVFILFLSYFYLSEKHFSENEQIHGVLQDQFQILVSDFVEKKHPKIDEIIFHKVWTKNMLDKNQIKIFFSYSLMTTGEAGGDLLIDGEALLVNSEDNPDFWFVKEFQVMDSFVEFNEPLLIKATNPSS